MRSADVAEDLVQDVFASVWRLRDRLDAGPGMRAYLYAATRARTLNHLAHERVEERGRQEFAVPDGPDSALPSAAEDALAQGELAEAVQRVLEIMPPRQREVVALRLRDQLTAAEIGARLGISPRTVEVHIARATHTLRELLPKLLGEIPRAR